MSSDDLNRVLLKLHYVGSKFHGWQLQPDQRTVQGEIEAVLERISGSRRPVIGSGRTDTGVHAIGQVAAVDMPAKWTVEKLHRALDGLLPNDVWVEEVRVVPRDFHPRFDALARSYIYRVGLERSAMSPFHRPWCWSLQESLDVGLMAQASTALLGDHSFLAFAKAGQPERGDRCTVHAADWAPWDGLGVALTITANRYLHHMVRYLVGTMVDIGRGRRPVEDVARLLAEPEGILRTSPPAPPEGLYLARVQYPETAYGHTTPDNAPLPDALHSR